MENKHTMKVLLIASILILSSVACSVCGFLTNLQSKNTPTEVQPVVPHDTPVPQTDTPHLPKTVHLIPDGSGDYPDLASAVADLAPGSTIILAAGEYTLKAQLVVNYPVSIIGAGKDLTTIWGNQTDSVITFNGPGIFLLQGVAIKYNGVGHSSVVEVNDADIEVIDCRFSGAVRDLVNNIGGSGLKIKGRSSGTVRSSVFELNNLHGLSFHGTANFLVDDCFFYQNGQSGIVFWDDTIGEVKNSISQDNTYNGFSTSDSANVLFENDVASGNLYNGFRSDSDSILIAKSNGSFMNFYNGFAAYDNSMMNLDYNQIHNNTKAGVRSDENSKIEAQNNEVYENGLSGFLVRGNSQVIFTNNISRDNTESGFVFFGTSSGTISDNNCYGNAFHGIALYEDAAPTLGFNKCEVTDKRN